MQRPNGLIPGHGPVPASVMLVAEAGGETEHRQGRPFAGKAGAVLTAYLRAAGLSRSELFITNVYPFWTGPGNPDPTPEQIRREEWRLEEDIKRVRPTIIAAVGRIATRWFLGDVDLEEVHGVPHASDRAPGCIIIPTYHPAAGFYEPERAAFCQEDFMALAYYIANPAPVRRAPKIHVVLHDEAPEWIEDAAVDTEGLEDKPWGLSWTQLRGDHTAANVWVYGKGKRVPKFRGFILFHHALHDLKILRAMGIDTSRLEFGDTMVKLFNLQLEPQGLKPAAFRHVGLRMSSFDEVVRPYFNDVAIAWLRRAATFEYKAPDPIPVADYTKRKNRIYKPQHVGRRIANLIRSFEKDQEVRERGEVVEKPVKLEKRWSEIGETAWVDYTDRYQAQAEHAVGTPFPDFSIFHVPIDKAVEYSGTDAAATALIDEPVSNFIRAKGLIALHNLDRRALPFVDKMQEVGMRVDIDRLGALEDELTVLREKARKNVQRVVGDRWFNPGSGDQVARWLYSYKGLPVLKRTDTGRGSTSDEALQMLRGYHSQDDEEVRVFIQGTQDYREADKYLGTYVHPILLHVRRDANGDWRIHASFKATRVVSGRLSSADPNVLAIPVRSELGKKIRYCFVARDGWVLIDADLSQLELRIGAHFSRDRRMRTAFENGEDLHALTASIIFKVALHAVTEVQRYVAKTINFAVFYGITAKALLEQLYKANIFDYQLENCEHFIREWFAIYSSVRDFQRRLWTQAEKDGYVRTLWGRMCYVPNLRVMDDKLKAAAQRLAANFPVQGSAADLVKRAETRLYDFLDIEGLGDRVVPWLQMHDELLLEAQKDVATEMRGDLEAIMTADARRFTVPIKAKAAMGDSWGSAKG